ncbi:YeiH family protein [Aureimonas sp. AU4]|uniref:YeiH family protein n=1 Tax=Aureimonas sp. AU4 TaxID=1638163 RepID=UPI00078329FB|nr:YeiH family protein [Aureimonas sp. AU4]
MSIQTHAGQTGDAFASASRVLPGIALTGTIAAVAILVPRLLQMPALSPLVVAMVIGITLRNLVGPIAGSAEGVAFSMRRILRFAIVLLGLQLTVRQIGDLGWGALALVAASLVSTFFAIKLAGRLLGVERGLTELIAAGTSICGASAVIATNTVTRARDEDVAYAIACVTVFGTLSMLLLPVAGSALGLDAAHYGLWVGASVHEVAQVVGAAFQGGPEAGQFGTVAKLSRVLLLAPMILLIGTIAARGRGTSAGRAPMPWFVFGFIAMVLLNSVLALPGGAREVIVPATSFLLAMALAAMGLTTDIGKLRAKGLRPLALGAVGWIFITLFALVGVLAL